MSGWVDAAEEKGPGPDVGGIYAERGRVEQSAGIPEADKGPIYVKILWARAANRAALLIFVPLA